MLNSISGFIRTKLRGIVFLYLFHMTSLLIYKRITLAFL